jgi:glycine/D-amino acid oxidase-like deaminating enzyme
MSKAGADVVVVGGGISGACTALHLAERNAGQVVLLERGDLASGTSLAGAGFVMSQAVGFLRAWGEEELEAELYGLEFYRGLSDEGYEIRFRANGNLWLAVTEEGFRRYLGKMKPSRQVPDRRRLSPDEVTEITEGFIRPDAVAGAVLDPRGAHISAPQAVHAVAERFTRLGGRIETGQKVTTLEVDRRGMAAVRTEALTISTRTVVIAAGPWTNSLLKPLGIVLPILPLVASRVTTEPIGAPGRLPTVVVPDLSTLWFREHEGALVWGCPYDVKPRTRFVDRELPDEIRDLGLQGVAAMESVARSAMNVCPALAKARTAEVAQAAPTFTPDARALLGPVETVPGLFVFAGDNEAGITHGPGFARLLADHMTGTYRSETLAPFRPERFGADYPTGADILLAMKAREDNVW